MIGSPFRPKLPCLAGVALVAAIVASCATNASTPAPSSEVWVNTWDHTSGTPPAPSPSEFNPWDHTSSSSDSATPDVELTQEPAPTPMEPTDPYIDAAGAFAACAGIAQPGAPAYAGSKHPIVVVDFADPDFPEIDTDYDESAAFVQDWGSAGTQLVACVGAQKSARVSYCGDYKRVSDGKIGAVYRYRHTIVVKIMVAKTGKQLQAKTILGKPASCKDKVTITSDPPPWGIFGGPITTSTIDAYIRSVAKI